MNLVTPVQCALSLLLLLLLLTLPVVTAQPTRNGTNTQCVNATVIPTRATFPYIRTNVIYPGPYPPDLNPPDLPCTLVQGEPSTYNSSGNLEINSGWYKFIPNTTGYYNFNVLSSLIAYISIMEGRSCTTITKKLGCRQAGQPAIHGVYLESGKSYYITQFWEDYYNSFDQVNPLSMTLTAPGPANDDCRNAARIPSDIQFPYTTAPSTVVGTTMEQNEILPSCDIEAYQNLSTARFARSTLWYTFVPPMSGYYDFTFNGEDGQTTIAVYETTVRGTTVTGSGNTSICDHMKTNFTEVFCRSVAHPPINDFWTTRDSNTHHNTRLKANTLYYIQAIPNLYIWFSSAPFTLTINQTMAPPNNDMCQNAFSIDPFVGVQNISIDTSHATSEVWSTNNIGVRTFIPLPECPLNPYERRYEYYPGIWYKYTHPNNTNSTVVLVDNVQQLEPYGQEFYQHKMNIYTGTSCQSLQCHPEAKTFFGIERYTVISEPLSTHWLLFSDVMINASIGILRSYFNWIDADTDKVLMPIIPSYYTYQRFVFQERVYLPTSQLNIQAYFDPALPVASVRVTYDNATRCERRIPFSIFGDIRGNYHPAPIQLGDHYIAATPYTGPGCSGPVAGETITRHFYVYGCSVEFRLYNSVGSRTGKKINFQRGTSIGCGTVLGGIPTCGFPIKKVTIELRNLNSNTTISGDTVSNPSNSAINNGTWFFGARDNTSTIFGVRPSSVLWEQIRYEATMTINNIRHFPVIFAVIPSPNCTST